MQEHLRQARLVFQPETGVRKRLKLAGQLLPGLIGSMAGSKCKQVLHIPVHMVQALKVYMLTMPLPAQPHTCTITMIRAHTPTCTCSNSAHSYLPKGLVPLTTPGPIYIALP